MNLSNKIKNDLLHKIIVWNFKKDCEIKSLSGFFKLKFKKKRYKTLYFYNPRK